MRAEESTINNRGCATATCLYISDKRREAAINYMSLEELYSKTFFVSAFQCCNDKDKTAHFNNLLFACVG